MFIKIEHNNGYSSGTEIINLLDEGMLGSGQRGWDSEGGGGVRGRLAM